MRLFGFRVIEELIEIGIIAIIRTDSPDKAEKTAEACMAGGLNSIEVTFSVPHAAEVIASLDKKFGVDQVNLGAGTVMDPETARIAILAGAKYIVSPYFCPKTANLCNLYKVPYIPGCMTIKEIAEALRYGSHLIKLFPASIFDPTIIKAIKGPLPQASIMPTGGIDIDNAGDWIRAGSDAIAVGGNLTSGDDYDHIASLCNEYIKQIQSARQDLIARGDNFV